MPIIKDDNKRKQIVDMLTKAYWAEIETVMSYIANSENLDGIRAQEVKESLAKDINEELGHAKEFAKRIKTLYGEVPGSQDFKPEQHYLQPTNRTTDVVHVIKGVIQAEQGAVDLYQAIIKACDEVDPVTADMVTTILADEEHHLRVFEGYLKEYEGKNS